MPNQDGRVTLAWWGGDQDLTVRRRRVLIIDDSRPFLSAAQRVLESDFQVSVTDSRVQAIRLAAREQPDIALVDADMPLMSESDLVPSLRAECSARIFLCSASPETRLAARAEACAADGHLRKTDDPDTLLGALRDADRGEPRRLTEPDLVSCAGRRAFLAMCQIDDRPFRLTYLETGARALEALRVRKPGMMVVSADLPDRSLTTLCEDVRRDPLTRETSMVGLLAPDDPVSAEEFVQAGGNRVLTCPVSEGSVLATFDQLSTIAPRKDVRLTIRYRPTDAEASFIGFSRNISSTGMLIATGVAHETGEDLELDFTLPGTEQAIEARACVVRPHVGRDRFAYGVRFQRLATQARASIARLVHQAAG